MKDAGEGEAVLKAEARVSRAADDTVRTAQKATEATEEVERLSPGPASHRAAELAKETASEAEEVLTEQEEAARLAVAAAEQADELLLDAEARKVAAQVSPDAPFGVPGKAATERGPLRLGFLLAVGGLLGVTLFLAVRHVAHELLLLLIAAFIAVGLDPAVRWLVRRGMRRSIAVTAIAVTFLAGVAGFIGAAVPPLVKQYGQLQTGKLSAVPQLNDKRSLLGRLNGRFHLAEHLQARIAQPGSSSTAGLLHAGSVVVNATLDTVIVLVLIVYMLADIGRIKAAFYRLAPQHRRPRVGLLADEVLDRIGGYVLANVLTSVVAGLGNYVVLLVLGVPYALVLSVLVAVLDLVPLVGSTIGGAVVAVVALVGVSGTAAVITVVFHLCYRLLEDYVINPRVLKRTVDVSPLVTIVAVVIGGGLLGIVGALIAVPAAAAVQLLLTEVVYPRLDAQDLTSEHAAAD